MKKDNDKEKLVPIIVILPKEKKEMLEKLASKQGRFESDIIRSGIEKELKFAGDIGIYFFLLSVKIFYSILKKIKKIYIINIQNKE